MLSSLSSCIQSLSTFLLWHRTQRSGVKDEFSPYLNTTSFWPWLHVFFPNIACSILFPHLLSEPGLKSFKMTFRPDGVLDVYLRHASSRYSWKWNPDPVAMPASNMTCLWASKLFCSVTEYFLDITQSCTWHFSQCVWWVSVYLGHILLPKKTLMNRIIFKPTMTLIQSFLHKKRTNEQKN